MRLHRTEESVNQMSAPDVRSGSLNNVLSSPSAGAEAPPAQPTARTHPRNIRFNLGRIEEPAFNREADDRLGPARRGESARDGPARPRVMRRTRVTGRTLCGRPSRDGRRPIPADSACPAFPSVWHAPQGTEAWRTHHAAASDRPVRSARYCCLRGRTPPAVFGRQEAPRRLTLFAQRCQ